MTLGVLVLHLVIAESRSLKDKRSILLHLFSRIRRTFNVSVSEVGDRDTRDRAVVAVAEVNTDKAHCNSTLLAVRREVEDTAGIVLNDFTLEFI
jgi:uncharacterized protein YlxP (DUF503 family)